MNAVKTGTTFAPVEPAAEHAEEHSAQRAVRPAAPSPGGGRSWAGWLLVTYLVPLAVLVFTARRGDPGLPQLTEALLARADGPGLLAALPPGQVEAGANVLVFIPIGFLVAGLLGRRTGVPHTLRAGLPGGAVWLAATALSAAVELAQLFLLTERSATVRDLVCNAAGALVGVLVYRAAEAARHPAGPETGDRRGPS